MLPLIAVRHGTILSVELRSDRDSRLVEVPWTHHPAEVDAYWHDFSFLVGAVAVRPHATEAVRFDGSLYQEQLSYPRCPDEGAYVLACPLDNWFLVANSGRVVRADGSPRRHGETPLDTEFAFRFEHALIVARSAWIGANPAIFVASRGVAGGVPPKADRLRTTNWTESFDPGSA